MRLNADVSRRAVAFAAAADWRPCGGGSTTRRLLERDGDGGTRLTAILRYPPGTAFPPHTHPHGEELLVLSGAFEDEQGRYPFGTYVRNPPGSRHAPSTAGGCAVFVKVGRFHAEDRQRLVVDTRHAEWFPGLAKGVMTLPLFCFGSEVVGLVRYAPGTVFPPHTHPRGEEILVLEGLFEDEEDAYPTGTWLRNPPGSRHRPFSLQGCLLYVKCGHLPEVVTEAR